MFFKFYFKNWCSIVCQPNLFKNLTRTIWSRKYVLVVSIATKPRLNKVAQHRIPFFSQTLTDNFGLPSRFSKSRLTWLGATLGIESSALYRDRVGDSAGRGTGRCTGAVVSEHAQPARKSQYSLSKLPRSKRLEADSLPARVRSQQH